MSTIHRLVPATNYRIGVPAAAVYSQKSIASDWHTELMFGDPFNVVMFDEDGWVHGNAPIGGYDGFVRKEFLRETPYDPQYRVKERSVAVWNEPRKRALPIRHLGMNARVDVGERDGPFLKFKSEIGWFHESDLALIEEEASDWVEEAEKFVGSPYVWGGRNGHTGIDCSGLVVNGLLSIGIIVPHNAGRIRQMLANDVPILDDLSGLQRGDLVFWNGHVGIMLDERRLLHATDAERYKRTVIEPLSAVARFKQELESNSIVAIKRL